MFEAITIQLKSNYLVLGLHAIEGHAHSTLAIRVLTSGDIECDVVGLTHSCVDYACWAQHASLDTVHDEGLDFVAVFCFGDRHPIEHLHRRLHVHDRNLELTEEAAHDGKHREVHNGCQKAHHDGWQNRVVHSIPVLELAQPVDGRGGRVVPVKNAWFNTHIHTYTHRRARARTHTYTHTPLTCFGLLWQAPRNSAL